MAGFIMDKDSALRICNSIYAMMLGFTVNNMLLVNKNWSEYSITLSFLSAIIICYYILDWFSFNALATMDKTQESIEVFFGIIFIIALGWLMVFANNILPSNVNHFILYSSIYLVLSSGLFLLRLFITMKVEGNIDLRKDKFIVADFLVRIIIGFIGMWLSAIKKEHIKNDTIEIYLPLAAIIIVVVKAIRYKDLVKIIKKEQNHE